MTVSGLGESAFRGTCTHLVDAVGLERRVDELRNELALEVLKTCAQRVISFTLDQPVIKSTHLEEELLRADEESLLARGLEVLPAPPPSRSTSRPAPRNAAARRRTSSWPTSAMNA